MKKVSVTIDSYLEVEANVEDLIASLRKAQVEAEEKGYTSLYVDRVQNEWCDSYHYEIKGYRNETEAEKAKRIKLQNKIAETQRKRDLETLKALKEKYPDV